MQFNQLIKARKSVRGYQNKPVPREVIEAIIEVAKWAPSYGATMRVPGPGEGKVVATKNRERENIASGKAGSGAAGSERASKPPGHGKLGLTVR